MNLNPSRKKVILENLKSQSLIRLSIFRSNRHINAILIDDKNNKVLTSVSTVNIEKGKTPCEKSFEVGIAIAEKAKKLKIANVVFDRSCYKYHGRVKALAEGARKSGLKF